MSVVPLRMYSNSRHHWRMLSSSPGRRSGAIRYRIWTAGHSSKQNRFFGGALWSGDEAFGLREEIGVGDLQEVAIVMRTQTVTSQHPLHGRSAR